MEKSDTTFAIFRRTVFKEGCCSRIPIMSLIFVLLGCTSVIYWGISVSRMFNDLAAVEGLQGLSDDFNHAKPYTRTAWISTLSMFIIAGLVFSILLSGKTRRAVCSTRSTMTCGQLVNIVLLIIFVILFLAWIAVSAANGSVPAALAAVNYTCHQIEPNMHEKYHAACVILETVGAYKGNNCTEEFIVNFCNEIQQFPSNCQVSAVASCVTLLAVTGFLMVLAADFATLKQDKLNHTADRSEYLSIQESRDIMSCESQRELRFPTEDLSQPLLPSYQSAAYS